LNNDSSILCCINCCILLDWHSAVHGLILLSCNGGTLSCVFSSFLLNCICDIGSQILCGISGSICLNDRSCVLGGVHFCFILSYNSSILSGIDICVLGGIDCSIGLNDSSSILRRVYRSILGGIGLNDSSNFLG
jgi:hypothetical protein